MSRHGHRLSEMINEKQTTERESRNRKQNENKRAELPGKRRCQPRGAMLCPIGARAGSCSPPCHLLRHVGDSAGPTGCAGEGKRRFHPFCLWRQRQEGARLLPSRRKEKIHCSTATVWILLCKGTLRGANSTFMLPAGGKSSAGRHEPAGTGTGTGPSLPLRSAAARRGPGWWLRDAAPPAAGAAHGRRAAQARPQRAGPGGGRPCAARPGPRAP